MAGKFKGKNIRKDRIELHRSNSGLSQAQLATSANVPLECVVKAEGRGRRTNDVVIQRIADALGVNQNAIT